MAFLDQGVDDQDVDEDTRRIGRDLIRVDTIVAMSGGGGSD